MECLLDADETINIQRYDAIVQAFYEGKAEERVKAQVVLTAFQSDPNAWRYVDKILQFGTNPNGKFISLSILEDMIATIWNVLPDEQRVGVRNFVVGMIISMCQDPVLFQRERTLLNKANLVLVHILKKDWPDRWPQFIDELIGSSQSSVEVCLNNLLILRLQAEEIFDPSKMTLTNTKLLHLKYSLGKESRKIANFCTELIKINHSAELTNMALSTLQHYITWVSKDFLGNSDTIDAIKLAFNDNPETRYYIYRCILQVLTFDFDVTRIENISTPLVLKITSCFNHILTSITDEIANAKGQWYTKYDDMLGNDRNYLLVLCRFLTKVLRNLRSAFESTPNMGGTINLAHRCILKLTGVPNIEIQEETYEYWHQLALKAMNRKQDMDSNFFIPKNSHANSPMGPRRNSIDRDNEAFFERLREYLIWNMMKPDDLLYYFASEDNLEDESEQSHLYILQKETLAYLTNLDSEKTTSMLHNEMLQWLNLPNTDVRHMNSVCWAIGTIAGQLQRKDEENFIIQITKILMVLDERAVTTSEKSSIQSNIMYIMTKYTRFLRDHWVSLKAIIQRLVFIMKGGSDELREQAAHSFNILLTECAASFVYIQEGEQLRYIDIILNQKDEIIGTLNEKQTLKIIEAIAGLIYLDERTEMKSTLLYNLLKNYNSQWASTIQTIAANNSSIISPAVKSSLHFLLSVYQTVCSKVKDCFSVIFGEIFGDLCSLIKFTTNLITDQWNQHGQSAKNFGQNTVIVKIRHETLALFKDYFSLAVVEKNAVEIKQAIGFGQLLLDEFHEVPEQIRDFEEIECIKLLIEQFGKRLEGLLKFLIQCVLDIALTFDSKENPHKFTTLFEAVQIIFGRNFDIVLTLNPQHIGTILSFIINNTSNDVDSLKKIAWSTTNSLVMKIDEIQDYSLKLEFLKICYFRLLRICFSTVTDSSYQSVFGDQVSLLYRLLSIANDNVVLLSDLLGDRNKANITILHDFIVTELSSMYPDVQEGILNTFALTLMSNLDCKEKFKQKLRDFIVQAKESGGDSNAYLFEEEKSIEYQEHMKLEKQQRNDTNGWGHSEALIG
ncbi:hypothetical protein RNJ44_01090 [Nakaseomyces bracarensis]|uniref:Importin N-terminal domain-containing protein n=1 Tax=Nakaseomyces bracarensis TaxID=273131 RepID=A0ABR4NQX2_9SACH